MVLTADQLSAADPDRGDRDHENEHGDRGGDQEGPVEANRQRVLVGRVPRGRLSGRPGYPARRRMT
jgi:hypothetical protein